MLLLIALFALVLLAPLAWRAVRFLFRVHLWSILVCLPAGLLVRSGATADLRVFILVSAVWAAFLALWHLLLRRSAARGR